MLLRRLLALLAAASLAVACASGTDGDAAPGPSTTPVTGAAPDGAGAGGSAEAPVDGGGAGAPAATAPAPGQPGPTTTADAGTVPPDAGLAAPEPGPVGAYAGYYLRPDESEGIVVQVLAQEGAGPEPATVGRVVHVLAQVSGKPVGSRTIPVAGEARLWTADELRAVADQNSPVQHRQQAVLTLLFVRGGFADNERAVGIAVRSDVAAVFAERVDEAAGMLGDRRPVEEAVSVHEVGHLLGLVDLVLDTGRQDPEHPGHSRNTDSVMYYAVESTLLGSILGGGPPRQFDQADLDDLARIRNG